MEQEIVLGESTKKIENVIIGGGGVAGFCSIGALYEIFSEDDKTKPKLSEVKNFIGTSVGSIISTMLSCTSDQDYLLGQIQEYNIPGLVDNSVGFIADLYRLFTKFGYNKGDYAYSIVQKFIKENTGQDMLTFSKHYEITKKNLVLTSVNVNTGQIVYFNRLTHPDMEVALAVRMSMSIPVFYVPIKYTNTDTDYTEILGEEGLYVDGGLIDNFPVEFIFTKMFDLLNRDTKVNKKEVVDALIELYRLDNDYSYYNSVKDVMETDLDTKIKTIRKNRLSETISIKTLTSDAIQSISPGYDVHKTNGNILDFCSNIIDIFMNMSLKKHITQDIWDSALKIDIGNISSTNFDVGIEEINHMIDIGKQAAIKFKQNKQIKQN